MSGTSSTPIILGFVLGVIPFALWTAWMLRQEQAARATALVATPPGQVRELLVPEPSRRVVEARVGTFCRVAGSIAFTPSGESLLCTASAEGARPRWRRGQTAA